MSDLYPRDAQFFQSRAEENAASNIRVGIHFRGAFDGGLQLGRVVNQTVIDRYEVEGSS